MGVALLHAKLSKGKRLKVGACLVLESGVLVGGVNGLPKALGNELEYTDNGGNLVSKLEVIHAEQACLNKVSLEGISTKGATMYVSHAPCRHCCSNMIASGIVEVIWQEPYRDTSGLDLLRQAGVKSRQIKL